MSRIIASLCWCVVLGAVVSSCGSGGGGGLGGGVTPQAAPIGNISGSWALSSQDLADSCLQAGELLASGSASFDVEQAGNDITVTITDICDEDGNSIGVGLPIVVQGTLAGATLTLESFSYDYDDGLCTGMVTITPGPIAVTDDGATYLLRASDVAFSRAFDCGGDDTGLCDGTAEWIGQCTDCDTSDGTALRCEELAVDPREHKIIASDGKSLDGFGRSVSVSGPVAVTGAIGDADNGDSSGSAYVLRRNPDTGEWIEEQKLTASDGTSFDLLGISVSVSGDVALVGASGDGKSDFSGSAYVFRHDPQSKQWVEEQKLTASDAAQLDFFGSAVSVSGDVAVVVGGQAAYVFRHDPDAGEWIEEQKLTPGDDGLTSFGASVSVSGDVAVIGADEDDAGSAYVFRRNPDTAEWIEEQKLTASDGASLDLFGVSVSVSGDVAIVGASEHDDSRGAAYIFRYEADGGEWVEDQKLTASDEANSDLFGSSVSVSGAVAVVGARGDRDQGESGGSAYVFRQDSETGEWTEERVLTARDGAEGDKLGLSVSVSGRLVVTGAGGDDDNGDNSGSVYVFDLCEEEPCVREETKLMATDGNSEDLFGRAVSVSGDAALIGADLADENEDESGSAYVYRHDTEKDEWVEEEKLTADDGEEGDRFGGAVSLSGDVAFVGAHGDDDDGSGSGSVYIYRRDSEKGKWFQEQKIVASDATFGDLFGISVSVADDVAVIGASHDSDGGARSGAAYVFRYDEDLDEGERWVEEQKLAVSGGAEFDDFGRTVAVSGDVAIVGAFGSDDGGDDGGAAYIYRYDADEREWLEELKVTGELFDRLGISVSVSDDVVFVGRLYSALVFRHDPDKEEWVQEQEFTGDMYNFGGSVSVQRDVAVVGAGGFVAVFRYDPDVQEWVEDEELSASDDPDALGPSVSLSDGVVIAGSAFDDENGEDTGAAYIFELCEDP